MDEFDERDVFGKTFECECGRTHGIEPSEVIYADDAVARLPEVCARYADGRRAAMLMDARTRRAAGAEAAEALGRAGWDVAEIVLEDPAPGKTPVCDDVTKAAIAPRAAGADLLVPVGSGVVGDTAKWLAMDSGVPYVTFATAASMNGYASPNIAPTIEGVKSLVYGRAPAAVLTSPTVLKNAPYEMTGAGLGDVLAKSVSSADWYLNHLLFGDYYCRRSVGLIAGIEPLYLDRPADLARGDETAMRALFDALLLTGVAMNMADTSFPASGGEHLISHSLDMMSSVDGVPHDLHGRQVGVGTILAAELYERLLAVESPELVDAPPEIDRAFWGPPADVVAGHYAGKADRLRDAKELLAAGDTWDRLRAELSAMHRPPERIARCLSDAGAALKARDLGIDRDRLLRALRHAHEIRSRFTVLDLANLAGLMPAAASEIVEQWG